jgi:hypothetical protein
MLKNDEPYRDVKPETVRVKLNAVRRKTGELAPKKGAGKAIGSEPTAGPLNATYQRSALPPAKGPEQ